MNRFVSEESALCIVFNCARLWRERQGEEAYRFFLPTYNWAVQSYIPTYIYIHRNRHIEWKSAQFADRTEDRNNLRHSQERIYFLTRTRRQVGQKQNVLTWTFFGGATTLARTVARFLLCQHRGRHLLFWRHIFPHKFDSSFCDCAKLAHNSIKGKQAVSYSD